MNNPSTPVEPPGNRLLRYFGWLTLVVALVNVYGSMVQGVVAPWNIFNSDSLGPAAMSSDFLRWGNLQGWDLPPNPVFFPDMLLTTPLLLLTRNINVLFMLYGAAQVVLFVLGLLSLQRTLWGRQPTGDGLLLGAATICLLVLAAGKSAALIYLLTSAHHFGVLLVMPLTLYYIVQAAWLAPNNKTIQALLGLAGICLLIAVSDTLFLIQFSVPAVITLALLAFWQQQNWRRWLTALGVMLSAVGLGQGLHSLLLNKDSSAGKAVSEFYRPAEIANSSQLLLRWVQQTWQQEPVYSWLWIASMAALFLLLMRCWRNKDRSVHRIAIGFVTLFTLCSASMAVAAVIFSGNFFDLHQTRYLLPATVLPLFTGLPWLVIDWLSDAINQAAIRQPGGKPWQLMAASWFFWIFFGGALLYILGLGHLSAVAALPAQRDPTVQCLDDHATQLHLRGGMAQFWQARYFTMLTHTGLQVVQVQPDLSIYHWNNNLNDYRTLDLDFVMIDTQAGPDYKLDQALILNRFGAPASTFRCGGSKVLVYNRPADLPFRRYLQAQPMLASFDQVGAEFTFYGSTLPTMNGALPIGLSRVASERWGNIAGVLGFVPLSKLPVGRYYVEAQVYADSAETGRWTIVERNAHKRVILREANIRTAGPQTLQSFFTAQPQADLAINILYNGHGRLALDSIKLKRVAITDASTMTFEQARPASPAQAPTLTLLYPRADAFLAEQNVDFVWQWTGAPLSQNQAFEVRIWHEQDAFHYGAHDAATSRVQVRQVDDTFVLTLDLQGALSVQQHGPGPFAWTVGLVEISPGYRDLGPEAPAQRFILEK